jgi:hypothetical protein
MMVSHLKSKAENGLNSIRHVLIGYLERYRPPLYVSSDAEPVRL